MNAPLMKPLREQLQKMNYYERNQYFFVFFDDPQQAQHWLERLDQRYEPLRLGSMVITRVNRKHEPLF
jgi:hypothetical protein